MATSAVGESGPLPLKSGDDFPELAGQTVAGRLLDLPRAAAGKVAVVIFSFSRNGGHDAQNWAEHFSKDDPLLPIYTVIFLESVPRLFRSMAIARIRSRMPPVMLDRTLLLYGQQGIWEQRLRVTDENFACVVVLDRSGSVRWVSPGPFADSLYLRQVIH